MFKYVTTDSIIANVMAGSTGTALNQAGVQLCINVCSSLAQAASACCGVLFGLRVQRELVLRIHAHYFERSVLYRINKVDSVDGVDQRIVADVAGMREALAWLFGNPFAYLNYRVGFLPLSLTFAIMVVYALALAWSLTLFFVGSVLAALFAQLLASIVTSKAVERRQEAEGQLRLHYGRLRAAVESVTFFRGLPEELVRAERLLDECVTARAAYVHLAALVVTPTVLMYYVRRARVRGGKGRVVFGMFGNRMCASCILFYSCDGASCDSSSLVFKL